MGKLLASMCSIKSYISDPTVAEVFVAWRIVKFSRNLRFEHAMVERDAY